MDLGELWNQVVNYRIAIYSISLVFVGSAVAAILMAIAYHEIPERLTQLVMGSMATLAALIVPPK